MAYNLLFLIPLIGLGAFLAYREHVKIVDRERKRARDLVEKLWAADLADTIARAASDQARLVSQFDQVEQGLRAKLDATFKPESAIDCACGLCGSPKCRACGRGLLFGHLAGTPFCSVECSQSGPKAETWAEFVARTSE